MTSEMPVNAQNNGRQLSKVLAKLLLKLNINVPRSGRQQMDAKIALTTEATIAAILFIGQSPPIKGLMSSYQHLNLYASESYNNHMRPTAIYTLAISALLLIEPFVLRSDFSSFGTWLWFSLGIVGIVVFVIDKHKK